MYQFIINDVVRGQGPSPRASVLAAVRRVCSFGAVMLIEENTDENSTQARLLDMYKMAIMMDRLTDPAFSKDVYEFREVEE